jgi:hypothetical protein
MSLPKRLKAVQGLWIEDKKQGRGKTWLIEGDQALQQVPDGKRGKRYTLTKEENGDVTWGKGNYVLDKAFKAGDSVVTWIATGDRSSFAWNRLESGAAKTASGDAKAGEKRIDPADGKSYTKDQMMKFYSDTYGTPKIETLSYWLKCGTASGASKAKAKAKAGTSTTDAEQRVDPSDGKVYTLSEMRAFYTGTYSKKDIAAFWEECKVKPQGKAKAKAAVKPDANEKRIDPADGKAYTWEELRSFYSATYTKKAMESFWTECKPAGKAKAKAKTKVKAKAKK